MLARQPDCTYVVIHENPATSARTVTPIAIHTHVDTNRPPQSADSPTTRLVPMKATPAAAKPPNVAS